MREHNEAILMASDKEKNQRLWDLHTQLNDDVVFFKAKLAQLLEALNRLYAAPSDTSELTQDYNTLSTYISTLEKYLLSIRYSTKLGFININKMSDQDMRVLEAQAAGVSKMRDLIMDEMPVSSNAPVVRETPEVPSVVLSACRASIPESSPAQPDRLSALIDEAKTMDYNVSTTRVWMRRVGFVLGSLVVAAAVTALVAVMMTPAGSISAAVLLGLKVALPAFLGFLGVIHPVTTTTNINMGGGLNLPITTPVPSTISMLGASVMGLLSLRKSGILNPQREEDARNMQAATVNRLTDSLKKKTNALADSEVKNFLLNVVDYADKLFNEGVSSFMHETQQSKMKKARLILRETAKIIDGGVPESISTLLATRINESSYTFSDLLNCQRNTVSTIWKASSSFFSAAIVKKYDSVRNTVNNTFSFDAICKAV